MPDLPHLHARKYAAKWFADGNIGPPSDDNLAAAFAGCVRPARPDEYPSIREAIRAYRKEPIHA